MSSSTGEQTRSLYGFWTRVTMVVSPYWPQAIPRSAPRRDRAVMLRVRTDAAGRSNPPAPSLPSGGYFEAELERPVCRQVVAGPRNQPKVLRPELKPASTPRCLYRQIALQ